MDIIINDNLAKPPEQSEYIPNYNNYYLNILARLGYPKHNLPIAELLKRLHNLEGEWLVVSPIQWQATHNDAIIVAASEDFSLSEKLGMEFFLEFAKFVADDENIKVHYHNACTWLMQDTKHSKINAKPVYSILNKSIMPELESLDVSLYWQRFITESQMYFKDNPLNKKIKSYYHINGLWVWGCGTLKPVAKKMILVDNAEDIKLAKILAEHVNLFDDSQKIKKSTLLLCQTSKLLTTYTEKFQKIPVNWHWNNVAYRTKAYNILGKICAYIKKKHQDR